MTVRYATAEDGARLAYRVDDHTDPWADAPYLLLLHGYGRSSELWYQWVPTLSRHYRIIRPDMRGFGLSREGVDLERNFDLGTFARDIITVLDDIGCDQVHYCGEAFGGTLGMQCAATYSDRIRSLSLVSSPVVLGARIKDIYTLGGDSWEDALRRNGIKSWVESTNTQARFAPWMPEEFLNWYADELAKNDIETLIAFSTRCQEYDQRPFLEQLRCPVLGVYPTARQEAVDTLRSSGVSDLTLQLVPSDYMLISFMYPEAVSRAVLNFIAQQDARVLMS